MVSQQAFGGSDDDYGGVIRAVATNKFHTVGSSKSSLMGNIQRGGSDYWLTTTVTSGNLIQIGQITYGGNFQDEARALEVAPDGTLLVGGSSSSPVSGAYHGLNQRTASYGLSDFWVLRRMSNGGIIWEASFGGSLDEELFCLKPTIDGGLIAGGISYSHPSGTKQSAQFGSGDGWLVKISATGTQAWERSYGGAGSDSINAVLQTPDGGYLLGATSASI
ncbi:MAG: hypothetical protein ACK4UN_20435, partial [Limisphaerales bacterium]